MPHLEIVTAVAAPPDRVFEACLDVEAHTRSMADSRPGWTNGMFTTRGLERRLVYSVNPTGIPNGGAAERQFVMDVINATFGSR